MSLNFGASSSFVQFGIGGAANVSNGACTLITLWKPTFGASTGLLTGLLTGVEKRELLIDTGNLFGDSDFSSGVPISGTAGDWLWLAMSKAAGSVHFRFHWKNFTTGGAWTHGEAVGAGNHADPGVSNQINVGATPAGSPSTGDVAVSAIKLANLADLAIEAACTSLLSDLIAAGPAWAARFMNSAPSSIQDLIGSGHETSRSGTITNSADPPGFNFNLGGTTAVGQQPNMRHPGRGTSNAGRFYQTPKATSTGIDYTSTTTDSAGLTDTSTIDRGLNTTDSAGLTDTAALDRTLVNTDSAGLTDTATAQAFKLVTQTDSAGLTDTAVLDRGLAPTDSTGLTDTSVLDRTLVTTDSAGLTDTSTVIAAKLVTQTDDAGLTDTTAIARTLANTDSSGLTDTTAMARSQVATDSAGLTDSSTAGLGRAVTQTDSAGLTDTLVLARTLQPTDSAGLADTAITTYTGIRTITDDIGLTDTITTSGGPPVVLPTYGLDTHTTSGSTDAASRASTTGGFTTGGATKGATTANATGGRTTTSGHLE